MSRTFVFAALAGLMLSTPVAADTSGCAVLLCTSPAAPPWPSIPECIQPVMTAYWMADHGMGWPQCPEAAGSQSSRSELWFAAWGFGRRSHDLLTLQRPRFFPAAEAE